MSDSRDIRSLTPVVKPFGPRGASWLRAVGAGGLTLLLVAGCGQGQAEEGSRIASAEVIRQDLSLTAEATGQLEPLRTVEVKSRASGEVVEVSVDTGERVEPGTLLARVDPRDVQNDYNQAEADFEVAQERFRNAEAQLRRSENLLAAEVITEQEHEGRNLDFANARSQMIRAETNLNLARMRLEDVTIRSRMHGTVLERLVEEGQVISSAAGSASDGTLLMTLANLDVMQVRTLVDETDVGRIDEGMPVNVVVDAYSDRTFEGKVEKIEPQATVQSNVVMYPVIVNLDNSDGILRPGMSAEVTVLLAERPNALTLPNNAIVSPRDIDAAGAVLQVPESRLELDRSAFQDLTRQLREQNEGEGAGGRGADARPEGAASRGERTAERPDAQRSGEGGAAPAGRMDPERMRQAMASGDGAAMRRAMAQRGQQARPDAPRQGVVFVIDQQGQINPRPVLMGVNDWNNTEILVGIEEGEQVALIGGAQLQQQQQAMAQRMRRNMGGLPFGR